MKGQVSTELLVIVGVVLVIFIPLLVMVYTKAGEAQSEMSAYQAQLVAFRLAYLANSVGSLGSGTVVYTDVYIPRNTVWLRAKNVGAGAEIQLRAATDQGPKDFVEVVKFPFEGGDSATGKDLITTAGAYGWKRIKMTSVNIGGQATITIE
ncbi:MAG: hypothetical protein V1492_03620 [Candidatus Micrarchaeota archaeon]